jgi:hypothetical protein
MGQRRAERPVGRRQQSAGRAIGKPEAGPAWFPQLQLGRLGHEQQLCVHSRRPLRPAVSVPRTGTAARKATAESEGGQLPVTILLPLRRARPTAESASVVWRRHYGTGAAQGEAMGCRALGKPYTKQCLCIIGTEYLVWEESVRGAPSGEQQIWRLKQGLRRLSRWRAGTC